MRDQYNFLKAIDTSSSSPELKESHRPRRQQSTSTGVRMVNLEAASSSTSSNSNNNNNKYQPVQRLDRAGLIKSKLQNLVRPRRFQLSSSDELGNFGSSRHQQQESLHFARQEDDCDEENDNNPDDSDEEPNNVAVNDTIVEPRHRLLLSMTSPESRRQKQVVDSDIHHQQQQQQLTKQSDVPIVCQFRKRPVSKRQQLVAAMKYREPQQLRQFATAGCPTMAITTLATSNTTPNQNIRTTNNQKQTSIVAQAQAAANYSSSETSRQLNGRQELAKCYDEIDQIYDYIRGLAPLPANLRKIKAIDFEQIEREHQRQKISQQQASVDSRLVHHQHRQHYVRSIESSSRTSGSAVAPAAAMTTTSGGTTKAATKVRQRVVAELIKDRDTSTTKPPTQVAKSSSKLRETLQFIVPLPIRVTTKSSESQKPSIKRVESLNLGSNGAKLVTPEAKLIQSRSTKQLSDQNGTSLNSSGPNYLISSTQRGQLFRLPRAHSTSTLNKPSATATSINKKRPGVIDEQKYKQQNQKVPEESSDSWEMIEEDFPLVRLSANSSQPSGPQFNSQTGGSLGRMGAEKKRPSFESDLVESYVDDDDDGDDGVQIAADNDGIKPSDGNRHNSISLSSNRLQLSDRNRARETSSESSSSSEEDAQDESSSSSEDDDDDDDDNQSASASERWSYADDSSKNQRLADKSHSDYGNDSASETSETTATTTTSNDEDDAEIGRSFNNKDATSQHTSSSKRSHQLRPTTSSSPSSGRPASPVDTTNESDEMEMFSAVSHKSSSSASASRRKQLMNKAKPRHEEHIYEQIPAHRGQDQRAKLTMAEHQQKQTTRPATMTTRLQSAAALPRRSINSNGAQQNTINYPVAYAANVAANRRYQQQVAALFALQQQRDRHLQLTRRKVPMGLPLATVSYHPNHQRRASASNTQFMSTQAPSTPTSGGGPLSLNVGSLKWKHQATRQLADVPQRQRLSMSNIHLLSGAIPLANLCSPRSKQQQQSKHILSVQSGDSRSNMFKAAERKRAQNTNSLDDQEAGSTGTTNSTSSYEAAIKNSEPDPLRNDMISPSDGEQSRHPSSKRSIGSGSGSRSLTNQSHQSFQNNNIQQQPSTLMKVPKLSKQSHLLQRPLPKPPGSSNRSYTSGTSSRQPNRSSSTNRSIATTSQSARITAIDVFS